ncbi:PAS domain S-box protein (plasmid) [Halorarum halophilum]|uniref:histidine kinase n=1 Tax=Halorarum halophilum TaxID=2743090 RepID=A0A7D5KYH0_9EURY|nr:ATP-binding protein [Halobaculum halophilum]QLG29878.1 PAS domain S-box protein [Halobaculum halophilum]
MTGTPSEDKGVTKEELQQELRRARSQIRTLESELTETNEGMVALTLELEHAKERYQTIFEESTDGILLIDPDQNSIHEANPQACDLLGYDHDTLVTLSPAEIFPDETNRTDTFAEVVVQGWADGFTCRTKNGRKTDVDISASIITLDDRSLLLASLRDITERKRREQRLQVLSRIFRHNLRNDGNVIQGHADILCDSLSDQNLEASALQIRDTIDEILQLSSKVRRVQDILDRNRVHRSPLSELLTSHYEWVAQTHPTATLTIDLPEQDLFVGRRLSVAIAEAVENAAKHAESEPTIEITGEVDGDSERIWIEIRDDGPGIPEQELQVMQSGSETPLTHGSGIGLWLIYWVIDSLGGEVTVQSDTSGGTLITMIVPLETEQTDSEHDNRPSTPTTND